MRPLGCDMQDAIAIIFLFILNNAIAIIKKGGVKCNCFFLSNW